MTAVLVAIALTRESTSTIKGASAVAAQDFFDSLESRADASKLAGMSNSYLFDIEGEGQWLVDVRDGAVTLTSGGGDADATITTPRETVGEIRAGDPNPTTA